MLPSPNEYVIFVVWTAAHGIEPPTFCTADEARLHANKLRELAAYRCSQVFVSSLTASRDQLNRDLVPRTF
jgi:hypothetical protein